MTREELIVLIARVMEPDRIEITPGHEDCDICQDSRDYILQRAEDALLAIEASGVAIVPVEPTQEMVVSLRNKWNPSLSVGKIWNILLAANPLKP